jgi:transposase
MELVHRRCCGLDVHKEAVVACLGLVADGKVTTEVRTFQTTTADLLRLFVWLAANECTHVAMEATGVYWKPVWHILDDGDFVLVLANAAHVKNVPGRKTDVNDAMWLAELLAHGLIRASCVPDAQTQEMRNLPRTRKQLVREQSSHVPRVQKTLEDANIKLDSVLTDLMGKSGRAMLEALIAGETSPAKLASLADRRVKASPEEFREALRGRVTKHHSLPAAPASQSDRRSRRRHGRGRRASGDEPWALSHRSRPRNVGSRHQEPRRSRHRLRNRHRHEPIRFGRTSPLMGLHMSAQRRECRQASIQSHAQGRYLAQNHAGAVRLGGG